MSGQPDFSTSPRPSRRRAWERLSLAVAAVAAALVAWAAVRAREEAASAGLRLAQTQQEVSQLSARLRVLEKGRPPAIGVAQTSSPTRIVSGIAQVLPRDARLEALHIDYEHGTAIEMRVTTRDVAAWDRLLDRLASAAEFREVTPGPELREGPVTSAVHARWVGGQP